MDRRIRLLVNPAAGGGRAAAALPGVEAALAGHGLEFTTSRTTDLDDARRLADEATNAGEAVVTLSGDGLVGCVAGVLRDRPEALLGILPGGRGNDFARVLGIPLNAVAACDVIARGVERLLDVGDVGGRTFIGIASFGFDSVANKIANEAPPRLGNLVYAYAALRALAGWRPARFDLDLDGERLSFTGYSVAAANSKAYGGGMYAAPDAELDDGMLDVVFCDDLPKRRFLGTIVPKSFKGTHVNEPEIHVHRVSRLRAAADRPFVVYADGDPIGELPVEITVAKRALNVLVPAEGV
jgi:YegS/Rv2252/BmrU family lipid kinase